MKIYYCDVCGDEIEPSHRRGEVRLMVNGKVSGLVHTCSNKCELVVRDAFAEAAPGPGRAEDGQVGRG